MELDKAGEPGCAGRAWAGHCEGRARSLHETNCPSAFLGANWFYNPCSMSFLLESWKQWARNLKVEVFALYLAYRDPRVPLYARIFAAIVAGYAFSPIDLIPDFIPVLGYLDDLVLIPLGVAVAIKLIPASVLAECRERSRAVMQAGQPVNRIAAAIIVAVWLLLAAWGISLTINFLRG